MVRFTRSCILFIAFLFNGFNKVPKTMAQELVYSIPCETTKSDCSENSLEAIVTNLSATEGADVLINIEKHYLNLSQPVAFKELNSLIINGHPNLSTTINCTLSPDGASIAIDSVRNVTLSNLTLAACGSQFMVNDNTYSTALTLKLCSDVNIINLVITQSQGIGLMVHHHWGGTVLVSRSNFTENKQKQEVDTDDNRVRSGGGVYIGYFSKDSNHSVAFKFELCHVERNVAHTKLYTAFYTDEFGERRTGRGRGGGALIELKTDISHSDVSIFFSHCTFNENEAFFGGGLAIHIGRGNELLTITKVISRVENTIFTFNGCGNDCYTRIGGGVHLSYNFITSSTNSVNDYSFHNVAFSKSCAELGGGVSVYSSGLTSNGSHLVFDNCTFEENKAHIGSAVDLSPGNYVTASGGYIIVPVFVNCLFVNNIATDSVHHFQPNKAQSTAGIGALYATRYDVQFMGKNCFEHNNGTALHIVNGIANFTYSSAVFNDNQGIKGGAIALIGTSIMVVGPGKEYTFTNNSAILQGGAIFVMVINNRDFILSRACFIQFAGNRYKDWNNSITFHGNSAPVGGTIFATTLHPCQSINNASDRSDPFYVTVNASEAFSVRGINVDDDMVVTEGAQLQYQHGLLHIIPGRPHNHSITIKDDMGNTVKEPLSATIQNDTEVWLDRDMLASYVGDQIHLQGYEGGRANLSFQTVSTRQINITFEVELDECPPGFKLGSTHKCECNFGEYYGLLKCDNDFHSLLAPGLWAGKIKDSSGDESELVTSVCPRSFCSYNNTLTHVPEIKLPWKSSDLQEAICGKTRKGVLCGECAEGYTTYFHSPDYQCKKASNTLCKAGWFFYIISELVPVTVVFITVLIFDINFTSGTVNGFILFSQILLSLNTDASGIITVTFPYKKQVTEGYQLLYGFLNLDFFTTDTLSFCFWPNATALDMLAFKYFTIVYALSLVILVIWFMNKCGGRCFGRCCRITRVKSSVIHGISAFFIICYSQSVTVSSSLLNVVEFWQRVNSSITIPFRVWHNGEIHYFCKEHLPYALPALLCISTIGILPPALLIAYPIFNKVLAFFGLEESLVARFVFQKLPVSSLKPLLDSFQGCFKDNLRFFAGIYFLYRWIAPIINSTTSSLGTTYIVTEILLILMLALHALFHPYQEKMHNVVDTLLFTNLLLINSITCIHYYLFQSQENRQFFKEKLVGTATIQIILIYLPLFIVFFYILVVGFKQIVLLWRRNKSSQRSFEEENDSSKTQMRHLRAVIRSLRGDSDDNDLPHRLIAGEVSYECFEDADCAQETYTETKSAENAVTY